MIRIRTLRELSRRNRSIARVRWRVSESVGELDTDGVEGRPYTWARWEEEYFTEVRQAQAAAKADPHANLRPRGVIDRVPARDVWAELRRESQLEGADPDMLEDYEAGYLRALYPLCAGPWRLQCDRLKSASSTNDRAALSTRES